MFLAKSPVLIKKYYPQLIWEIPNKENIIYLTFDDGPIPEVTEWVLDILEQYNVKATFFCIGHNIEKYPNIFEKVKEQKHSIGNHSFHHLSGWDTDDELYFRNIAKCQELTNTNLLRPPYGRVKKSQITNLIKDYKIVMWDVLSGDFDPNTSPEKCLKNVTKNTKSGSIIVFHDSIKAYENLKQTLPKAIEFLLEKGFVFDVLN